MKSLKAKAQKSISQKKIKFGKLQKLAPFFVMLVRNLKGKAECKLNAKKKKYEMIIR